MASMGKAPIARVKATGSIRAGGDTWLVERLTSAALVPLTLWFIVSAVGLSGASYEEVRAWLGTPFNTTAMLLTVVTLFWHSQLGVQVILEDYVHEEPWRFGSLILNKFAHVALGLACVVAVLKVAFGS